ncbi:hypothetical protein [Paracoccus simplex]|uniref:Uncharacterized protein n=1 Tax=Paracoccus simplex TaxID=2086346 RepID=A0ABV7S509_9RHOB
MSIHRGMQDARCDQARSEADISAEEILRRIYALPVAWQLRTVEFLRTHANPELRACAKPLEDALILRRLMGGAP